jgi:hypothetical protein
VTVTCGRARPDRVGQRIEGCKIGVDQGGGHRVKVSLCRRNDGLKLKEDFV